MIKLKVRVWRSGVGSLEPKWVWRTETKRGRNAVAECIASLLSSVSGLLGASSEPRRALARGAAAPVEEGRGRMRRTAGSRKEEEEERQKGGGRKAEKEGGGRRERGREEGRKEDEE